MYYDKKYFWDAFKTNDQFLVDENRIFDRRHGVEKFIEQTLSRGFHLGLRFLIVCSAALSTWLLSASYFLYLVHNLRKATKKISCLGDERAEA